MELQTFLLVGLPIISIIVYLFYKLQIKDTNVWPKCGVPILKTESMISRLWRGTSMVEFDFQLYQELGDLPYAGYTEGSLPVLIVRDPEVLRKIYVKDFDYFINRRMIGFTDENFKSMLINRVNQDWKDLRTTMTPTFTTGKIRRMFPIISGSSKKLINYLKDEIAKDNSGSKVVDLDDILGLYSMDIIQSAAFGIESGIFKDPDSLLSKMAKKISFSLDFWQMFSLLVVQFIPSSSQLFGLRFVNKEADDFFSGLLEQTIKHREATGEKRNDFLQMMIDTKHGQLQVDPKDTEIDENEKDSQFINTNKRNKLQMDDHTIIANCILFILAGYDTISSSTMFAAYCLALNPEIQDKLRQTLDEAVENRGGEINYDDINQLEYLDKVINESMRMYPNTTRTERLCAKDYILDSSSKQVIVPKDSLVAIPIFQIHHDANYFPNPEVFDPERFSPENKAKRSPYSFMPFGHGPRSCIGNRFGLTEVKTAIANLVMNFEMEPCAKTAIPVKFVNSFGPLKPVNGLWLKFKPRK